jgi:protein TonB
MLPFSVSIAPSAVSKGQMWMGNQRREAAMFETTLAASRPQRDGTRRLAALPAAVAVHALALGVMAVGQVWAVDPVRDVVLVPPLVVHLPVPLGSGNGSPARRNAGRAAQTRVHQQRVVQPVVVPVDAASATDREPSSDVAQVPGTEGFEDGPGTGPGIGDGPGGTGLDDGVSPEAPMRVGGAVRAPVPILRPAPRYPEIARKARIEGTVLVEATIDQAGTVVDARVLHDIGMGCGQAALDAIRGWRYEPATLNGRPVSVYLEVRVSFQLHGTG